MKKDSGIVYPDWEGGGSSRIPFAVYTDEQLHRQELERFFITVIGAMSGLKLKFQIRVTSSAPSSVSDR